MKYYNTDERSTACPDIHRTISWNLRLTGIPSNYFDKPYTQSDSMVRVRKRVINIFKTGVNHDNFRKV